LAYLIIDFKKDMRSKIHPELTDITVHYIPQAADQLETVVEATEKAANKIMDNLEGMQGEFEKMERIVNSLREGSMLVPASTKKEMKVALDSHTRKTIVPLVDYLESHIHNSMSLISDSFIQMSFQDLTGQRIKGLISLFGKIEEKLKKMVVSLGIKLTERAKNPHISSYALQRAVDEKALKKKGKVLTKQV
jgi:chemotaxis protein CheZ